MLDLVDYAQSDRFAERIDNIQDGFSSILDRTKDSVAYPWVNIIKSLSRKPSFQYN